MLEKRTKNGLKYNRYKYTNKGINNSKYQLISE